jgi:3'(2'), 5'-bisphosphate nucleotidase
MTGRHHGPDSDAGPVERALLTALTAAVARAGAVTLALARRDLAIRTKADQSFVTGADERSQAILIDACEQLMPGITVVAEEMANRPTRVADLFILIDPLDGTKEYIAGSSEYTVNIGIVRNGIPIAGIVAAPAHLVIYRGIVGGFAERLAMAADGSVAPQTEPIRVRRANPDRLAAMISRSHLDAATVALLDQLSVVERRPCGSALKFCRIAEGTADLYPRLATTCEWDVAAGHAVIAAAGGAVTLPDGGPLSYGNAQHDFRVPAFMAWGDHAGIAGATFGRGR